MEYHPNMLKRKRRGINKPVFRGTPCKRGHIAWRDRRGYCIECRSEANKIKHQKNKNSPAYKKRRAAYAEKSKEARKEYFAEYRAKNREALRKWHRDHHDAEKKKIYQKKYYAKNKTKISMRTRLRQTSVKRATPPWVEMDKIQELYRKRDYLTKHTGIVHHIDHVIPLRGKNICGLHVHTNLQILTAKENYTKRNKHECE